MMASINEKHLKTWEHLVELLTPEEFTALYVAMQLKKASPGEMIVTQGASRPTLIFINSGQLQVQMEKNGVATPIGARKAGEVIGTTSFFTASVWTVNVKSLGAELFLLNRQDFDKLKEEHPSLESKLASFCSGFQSNSKLLQRLHKNRRDHERKRIVGRLSFLLIDQREKRHIEGSAKGDMLDISRGGVSFSIHSAQKKNAIAL